MGLLCLLGAGLRAGVIGMSVHLYYQSSLELHQQIEHITISIHLLQNQVNSLVAEILQNHWALDVLTPEKGGMCAMLDEECCYFVNESGIVMGRIKNLHDS